MGLWVLWLFAALFINKIDSESMRICQLISSMVLSLCFAGIMFCRIGKVKRHNVSDKAFDYFSTRSYISRHKYEISTLHPEKYFILWKHRYPFGKYKNYEEFCEAQKQQQDNTKGERSYEKKLQEKLRERIYESSRHFIRICAVLAAVYALYCLEGIWVNNRTLKFNQDIGTFLAHGQKLEYITFKMESSLTPDTVEITLPATMVKYSYSDKYYHADNLVWLDTEIDSVRLSEYKKQSDSPILNSDRLRLYLNTDSIKLYYNASGQNPLLEELDKKLKNRKNLADHIRIENGNFPFSNQSFINKNYIHSYNEAKRENSINLLFDLLTSILLLFAFYRLSYTSTKAHRPEVAWNMIVFITFCTLLLMIDIYTALMLVENNYILMHWIIQTLASLLAAMSIAAFVSKMYPLHNNYLTGKKGWNILIFFIIYLYACANVITPFTDAVLNISTPSVFAKIKYCLYFSGMASLYFVMYKFSEAKNMAVFFVTEINALRTMEKENIGIKELHLLMHNTDRETDLLNNEDGYDELNRLLEYKKREEDLFKLKNQ